MRVLVWSCVIIWPLLCCGIGCAGGCSNTAPSGVKFQEVTLPQGKGGGKKAGMVDMEDPSYKGPKQ